MVTGQEKNSERQLVASSMYQIDLKEVTNRKALQTIKFSHHGIIFFVSHADECKKIMNEPL